MKKSLLYFTLLILLIGQVSSQFSTPNLPESCEKTFSINAKEVCTKCENTLYNNNLVNSNTKKPVDLTQTPCALVQAFYQVRDNFTSSNLRFDNPKLLDTYCSLTDKNSCNDDARNSVINTIKTDCSTELDTFQKFTSNYDNRRIYNDGQDAAEVIFSYYLGRPFRDALCSKEGDGYCFVNMSRSQSSFNIPDIPRDYVAFGEPGCENCAEKGIGKIYKFVEKVSDPVISTSLKNFLDDSSFKRYANACSAEIDSSSASGAAFDRPTIRFDSLFFLFIGVIFTYLL